MSEMTMTCSVNECAAPVRARELCSAHYQRWRKYGDPLGSAPRRERPTCSVKGCGRPHEARGFCIMHVTRLRRRGSTDDRTPAIDRFDLFVHRLGPHECWEWLGPRNNSNYGRVGLRYAHRVACERAHGPAPSPDSVAMHSCDNPPCVNPAHLSWGSQSENVKASWTRTRKAAS
jgi:hypothetical protein